MTSESNALLDTTVEGLPNLSALSSDEIKQRLTQALGRTAEGLAEMAACVRVLEERGDDLSWFRMGIKPYLRLIAQGQLLPSIVVTYAGLPNLLSAVAALPLSDQRHLIEQGTVAVAVVEQDGTIGTRQIDPRALPTRDIRRVFSSSGIVPPAKQAAAPKRQRREGRRYSVRVAADREHLLVGKARVPIAEVLTVLSEEGGWGGVIDEDLHNCPTAAAKLLPAEKERLVAFAKATGLEEWEIVRRAILAWLVS
jgi:hypothetical protein